MLAHSRCSGSSAYDHPRGFPNSAGSGLGQWVSSLGFVDSGLVDERDPWCVLAVALPPVTEDRQVLLSAPWKTP